MRRLLLTLALSAAAPALAQVHQYGGLAISAGGETLATIESASAGRGGHGAITLRRASDGTVQRQIDPCPKCGYQGLTFGPAGDLAFVAREPGAATAQLMVATAKGAARTIATIAGLASTPRFSPDGKRIALLVTLGAAKETGATQAGVRQVGEIGEKSDEQRLAIFPVTGPASAAVTPISPADRFIYEYDWTPDGTGFVVTSALGNGDNNWWVATLDAVDATTGAVRNITRPATQLNYPRVSPDGRTVAYIGGLMSDNGSVGGDIWTVPLAGGQATNVTDGQPVTYVSLDWTAGGLRAVSLRGDKAEIGAIEPGRAPARPYYSQPVSLGAGDGRVAFSADGRSGATVAQGFTVAPAIHAGPLAAMKPVTRDNAAAVPAISARSISWKSDQFTAQGWLLGPTTPPTGKAPMIVSVHGGPSAASTPRFIEHGPASETMDAGYYVFLPNPRGSYGQGEAFTAANKRDFGGGDLRDILAGVDAAEKVVPIDDARLGLTGCSYGGFMAMWANTQTNRFKAIVAGAGLSNWISYYGTNGIDQWMIPFTGKSAYDDHKVYEDMSAVYHVKSAKTPTFIYVGERDIEVPPTQSIEWWHALKNQGVETSLVIYPDAGHCVSRPDQAADVRARQLAWFNKYLAK